jgi:CubicO group peptidase (beta-lactamase class C family)
MNRYFLSATILALAGFFNAGVAAADLEGLADWLEHERERWQIPGMAVAVVHDDEVVFARGFGLTRLANGREVDDDTQFGIASLSKAMTVTALGLLVDEGRLTWDDRVVDHLPEFALSDPWVTAQVTLRDLLAHRVGVGRLFGNRLTFMPGATRAEFIGHLRHHQFEQPFRQGYVYSNAMYTVAGAVLEAVSGQTWESFVEERLFGPLGMQRSNTSVQALDANAAWPHQEIAGELIEIERRDWTYAGPAASVNASIGDLATWMRFNLGEPGELDGERLLTAETMARIHRPVNLTGFDDEDLSINAYAMGWGVSRYQNLLILRHGGATDGMNTQIWLVPELGLGVVMSANRFTRLREPVMRHVVDRIAGHEPHDWSAEAWEEFSEDRKLAAEDRDEIHQARQSDTRHSHELSTYTGIFHHDLYGEVEVYQEDDGLVLRFWNDDSQQADLEHWHFDTFLARWHNRAQREKFVWFVMGEDGMPVDLKIRFTLRPKLLEEGVYPASYTRTVRFTKQ